MQIRPKPEAYSNLPAIPQIALSWIDVFAHNGKIIPTNGHMIAKKESSAVWTDFSRQHCRHYLYASV
jgi:hypothetical protein